MQLCIFEDRHVVNFLPLVYFRPVYELRCGVLTLREKIEHYFGGARTALQCRPELAATLLEENPNHAINSFAEEPTWFINGRVVMGKDLARCLLEHDRKIQVFRSESNVAAAFMDTQTLKRVAGRMNEGAGIEEAIEDLPAVEVPAKYVQYPWELVHLTAEEIERDVVRIKKSEERKEYGTKTRAAFRGAHLLNRKNVLIGGNAVIKAGAVLDADRGPILIGKGATIMSNAVVEGPAYIGPRSIIKIGAKIYHGTAIGPYCKVGGEVETSIIQSYSNKQHDGYLGHSYLGSWVNIGADTNTSDLKNTYGTVRVYIDAGRQVDTGQQFVGLTMGDHSKTGISVMFDTGTVVGVSCNIFGAGLPPKFIPSFMWGEKDAFVEYQFEKSVETARRVMARRNREMSSSYEELFRDVFNASAASRGSVKVTA